MTQASYVWLKLAWYKQFMYNNNVGGATSTRQPYLQHNSQPRDIYNAYVTPTIHNATLCSTEIIARVTGMNDVNWFYLFLMYFMSPIPFGRYMLLLREQSRDNMPWATCTKKRFTTPVLYQNVTGKMSCYINSECKLTCDWSITVSFVHIACVVFMTGGNDIFN